MIQVVEIEDYDYINELIEQYPKTDDYVEQMKDWVHNQCIRKYIIIYKGKQSGAIWVCKFDTNSNVYYNLEGYRDKRIQGGNESFYVYIEAAKEVLKITPERPLLINHYPGERYARLAAKALGFKYWQTNHEGIKIYEYTS